MTLLGFIGTPWTLAAYAMEGRSDKDCKETKVGLGREVLGWRLREGAGKGGRTGVSGIRERVVTGYG